MGKSVNRIEEGMLQFLKKTYLRDACNAYIPPLRQWTYPATNPDNYGYEPSLIRRGRLEEKHVDDFTAQARRRIVVTIRPQSDIHTTGEQIEWYNGT